MDPSSDYLLESICDQTPARWRPLSTSICQVINDFSMVAFVPLNIHDEDSIQAALHHVDHAINYGEDLEPKVRYVLFSFIIFLLKKAF